MELQDSATDSTNLSLPLFGVWDQLESTDESYPDSSDPGPRATLPRNTEQPEGLTSASPESAAKQASLDHEFLGAQSGHDYARVSDDQLLAAAKSDDERAFEELCARHVGSIRMKVYSIVRNPEDTEDVVQDSLLRAYRHLHKFRESCNFSTWITRIAINTALMLLRKRKSRREVSLDQAGETDQTWSIWDIPDPSPSTERKYARQEMLEFMLRAVNRLPPVYRSVLDQYHAQEKSLGEAADMLGITVASAKTRLFRARRTLRSILERQQFSILDACY